MDRLNGFVKTNNICGQEVSFFVRDEGDVIQRYHASGQFYEMEELQIIAEFFKAGGIFVDIGSNIGNHSVYVGKYLHPKQIIAFEPNPPAIAVLKINLQLNGLQRIMDLTHLGVGLADTTCRAHAWVPSDNLGGTRLDTSITDGALVLIRGDDVLARRAVDFLKIDVEGMEMKVLAGLEATIAAWRPSIFIEIEDSNAEEFLAWTEARHYRVQRRFRRYDNNENYMLVPVERAAD
jgi:FkbM family methyltransferase